MVVDVNIRFADVYQSLFKLNLIMHFSCTPVNPMYRFGLLRGKSGNFHQLPWFVFWEDVVEQNTYGENKKAFLFSGKGYQKRTQTWSSIHDVIAISDQMTWHR